jgi:hypothetical protein
LKKAFERIELPTRLGISLPITFFPLVLVSSNARIDRPKRFDTSKIIKAEMLDAFIDKQVDKAGVFDVIGGLAKAVTIETLEGIGRKLVRMHKPATFDYSTRFGCENGESKRVQCKDSIPNISVQVPPPISRQGSNVSSGSLVCKHCGKGSHLSIQHGRYGYFMKCSACDGNSPIRISCGRDGHKERIRKEGLTFYRECPDCNTSAVYFINPAGGRIP